MGRLLGIDVGEKRVGLALSDELHITASPYKTLEVNKNIKDDLRQIVELENIEKAVVGLPRNMDGSLGFQAETVREFVRDNVEGICKYEYEDETLSSNQATTLLKERGYKKNNSKGLIDSYAAKVILESYISREEK